MNSSYPPPHLNPPTHMGEEIKNGFPIRMFGNDR